MWERGSSHGGGEACGAPAPQALRLVHGLVSAHKHSLMVLLIESQVLLPATFFPQPLLRTVQWYVRFSATWWTTTPPSCKIREGCCRGIPSVSSLSALGVLC